MLANRLPPVPRLPPGRRRQRRHPRSLRCRCPPARQLTQGRGWAALPVARAGEDEAAARPHPAAAAVGARCPGRAPGPRSRRSRRQVKAAGPPGEGQRFAPFPGDRGRPGGCQPAPSPPPQLWAGPPYAAARLGALPAACMWVLAAAGQAPERAGAAWMEKSGCSPFPVCWAKGTRTLFCLFVLINPPPPLV